MDGSIELVGACRYALRTFGTRAGLWGLVKEGAWLAAHIAVYPGGAVREQLEPAVGYRTDPLARCAAASSSPTRRRRAPRSCSSTGSWTTAPSSPCSAAPCAAAGSASCTPSTTACSPATCGTRRTSCASHVERLCEETGADKVHIVGHSLGGVIARYYVQRMGGSARVDTLVTLGSPHSGTLGAYLIPTALGRQLRPGSPPLTELELPAPGCNTRFLVVWSRMDQMVVPQRNARLQHPDLDVDQLELRDVGHLALPIDGRVVRWVVERSSTVVTLRVDSGDPPALDPAVDPAS